VKLIEARRKALRPFEVVNLETLTEEKRAETLRAMEPVLKDLENALCSKDEHILFAAVTDVTNGAYRGFPKDRLLGLLLPRLRTPETNRERMLAQSYIMEHLARWYGPKAKAALPDLLAMVGDDKVSTYLRGQAVFAAALIGPGDSEVVKVFIAALNNPNPKTESGVHDRIAERLGEMGKAAESAKPALVKLMERGSWYQDPAFIALGKIARDEKPRPLAEYLDRLEKLDKIPVEQAAAAFDHLVALGKTGMKVRVGHSARVVDAIAPEVANAARPVLLKIVEERPDDIFSRAAMRGLQELGPGASPRAAKAIVKVLLRDHSSTAMGALERMEPTDPAAAEPLAEAFVKVASGDDWLTPKVLAEALACHGKAARVAAPAVVKALRSFRTSPQPGVVFGEEFAAYLSVLAAVGGDEPGVRRVVIDLLDAKGDVLTKSGPNAPEYQYHLLLTLAKLGLPAEGDERKTALVRLRDGLSSDLAVVHSAAARVVIACKPLSAEEAKPLVPLLSRVFAADFKFKSPSEQIAGRLGESSPRRGSDFFAQQLAVQALGALGPAARDALPALKALAERPLEKRKSDFLPEPPINAVIKEAQKAVEAVR
jgi:hypothetical protein